jgi:hypothetical protein
MRSAPVGGRGVRRAIPQSVLPRTRLIAPCLGKCLRRARVCDSEIEGHGPYLRAWRMILGEGNTACEAPRSRGERDGRPFAGRRDFAASCACQLGEWLRPDSDRRPVRACAPKRW